MQSRMACRSMIAKLHPAAEWGEVNKTFDSDCIHARAVSLSRQLKVSQLLQLKESQSCLPLTFDLTYLIHSRMRDYRPAVMI